MLDQLIDLIRNGADDPALARNFLSAGVDVNFIEKTASTKSLLHLAIAAGKPRILELLLSQPGIDVEIIDENGHTPLIFAAKVASPEIINIILNKKPNLNARDHNGDTALHFAAKRNNVQVLKTLLDAGANPNIGNKHGDRPIHLAIYQHQNIPILAAASNLDVNIKNKLYETVAHKAVKSDLKNVLIALINIPSFDFNVKNLYGRSILEEAVYSGSLDCINELLEAYQLSLEDQERLCTLAAEQAQIKVLKLFQEKMPEAMEKVLLAKQILTSDSESDSYSKINFIEEMSQKINEGLDVTLEGGKVSFARIKEKKGNKFNGYIIDNNFPDFLAAIKERATLHPRGLTCIEFAIVDVHWTAGYIEINDGNISICLIDSLGSGTKINALLYDIIEAIPEAKLFEIQDTRQFSTAGCSIFVIDDCEHLSTIKEHLPKQYDQTGLFGYLADHQVSTETFKNKYNSDDQNEYQLIRSQLPLYLQRTTQSLKKGTSHEPFWISRASTEEQALLNKKHENTMQSVAKQTKTTDEKEFNKRLEYKLDRLTKENLHFMLKHTKAEIEDKMEQVTLEGLKTETQHLSESLSKIEMG